MCNISQIKYGKMRKVDNIGWLKNKFRIKRNSDFKELILKSTAEKN